MRKIQKKLQVSADKFGMYYTIISTRNTFMQSLTENGLENCKENPLRILPRTSLAAKAVATPKVYKTEENFSTVKCMIQSQAAEQKLPNHYFLHFADVIMQE